MLGFLPNREDQQFHGGRVFPPDVAGKPRVGEQFHMAWLKLQSAIEAVGGSGVIACRCADNSQSMPDQKVSRFFPQDLQVSRAGFGPGPLPFELDRFSDAWRDAWLFSSRAQGESPQPAGQANQHEL